MSGSKYECNYKEKLKFLDDFTKYGKAVELYCENENCETKIVVKTSYLDKEKELPEELKILDYISKNINSKHFAKFYGWEECNGKIIMFMEYIPMTLKEWINENHSIYEWINMLLQVNDAFEELNYHKIFHGDLHTNNILYDYKANRFVVIDFDIAEFGESITEYSMLNNFLSDLLMNEKIPFVIRIFLNALAGEKEYDFRNKTLIKSFSSHDNFNKVINIFSKYLKGKNLKKFEKLKREEDIIENLQINYEKLEDLKFSLDWKIKQKNKNFSFFKYIFGFEDVELNNKIKQMTNEIKELERKNTLLNNELRTNELLKSLQSEIFNLIF